MGLESPDPSRVDFFPGGDRKRVSSVSLPATVSFWRVSREEGSVWYRRGWTPVTTRERTVGT